jgi:plasmid stability protein
MAVLYVENVPEELYAALKARAREHRKSISAEVISLLTDNIPTETELNNRKAFAVRVGQLRSAPPTGAGPFPSVEGMLREDRSR